MSVVNGTVDARAIIIKFERATPKIIDALSKAIARAGYNLERVVKQDKLSGQVLKVRTGNLRRSIHTELEGLGTINARATVGTNVVYARIHEEGGTIPAHIVEARNGKALKFTPSGGATMFRRRVQIPDVVLPARSFLRSALEELRPSIILDIEQAIAKAVASDS